MDPCCYSRVDHGFRVALMSWRENERAPHESFHYMAKWTAPRLHMDVVFRVCGLSVPVDMPPVMLHCGQLCRPTLPLRLKPHTCGHVLTDVVRETM
jgi:hypothetical protein